MGERSLLVVSFGAQGGTGTAIEVLEFSCDDGSVLGRCSTTLKDFDSSLVTVSTKLFELWNGSRRLVLWNASELCVFDLELGEKVFSRSLGSTIFVADAFLGTDTIVLRQRVASKWRLIPYSLETGEALNSEIGRQALDLFNANCITLAGKRQDTLVFKCYDGILRAYALSDGSLRWESDEQTKAARFVGYVGDDRIVFQDALGRCHMLDATNGTYLASSQSILPEMLGCGRRADGDGIATLIYRMKSGEGSTGLAVFSLDDEDFGPVRDVRYGLYLSNDGTKVLCSIPWMDDYIVYPCYSLDDMLEQARGILDDFDFRE